MKNWLNRAWPKPDEQRLIWIEIIKASVIFVGGSIVLIFWSWWTNNGGLLWRAFTDFVPVPGWLLILLMTGTVGALLGLFRLYRKPAHVRRYLKDTLDHINWIWSYDENYQIINALPLCTACQTELTLTPIPSSVTIPGVSLDKTVVYCPTCNKGFEITGTTQLKESHALPKIRRRIRTGEWAKLRSTR